MPTALRPFACLLVAAALAAGEAAPLASPGGAEQAKKDALEVFARQANAVQAPNGSAPGIMGCYVWSGRADAQYKPFTRWELRIRAGSDAANQLVARIVTLGPMREELFKGDESTIGSIASGAQKDVSIALNCPTFTAYRVEMAWQGGKQSFLAWDRQMVPIPITAGSATPFIVTVNQNGERDEKNPRGPVTVTWNVWNIGGAAAKGVTQTIHFLDKDAKEVFKQDFVPDKGAIPGDSAKAFSTVVRNVPTFQTVSITTRQPDQTTLDPGQFTGAKDVEIAQVRQEDNKLKARVRNGTDGDVEGLVVVVTFVDAADKDLRAFEIPVGNLVRGGERDVSAPVAKLPNGWTSYRVAWKTADGQHSTTTGQTLSVQGVEVVLDQRLMINGQMKVSGTLTNTKDHELVDLRLTFHLSFKGKKEDVEIDFPRVGRGRKEPILLEPSDLTDYDSVSLEWKAGK